MGGSVRTSATEFGDVRWHNATVRCDSHAVHDRGGLRDFSAGACGFAARLFGSLALPSVRAQADLRWFA